jgi:D-alanyl-D-alanine carboxypeptidase/D-alanyl-D-alanine-endopeptidase (penicillin-binding protein 4)
MKRHLHSRSVLLFVLLLTTVNALAQSKELAKRIDTILAAPEVSRAFWGVEAVDLSSGKVLYSENADKFFTPASNTKLFTTISALALIGPDYRFRTSIETNGAVDKYGRLSGDLLLIGRGDPNLSGRTLPYSLRTERKLAPIAAIEALADQVAARGVKVVEGDIVADDSYYPFERYAEGWSQEDLNYEWGAPVSALTVNDNVMFVSILPGAHEGDKAFVSLNPLPEHYRVDNRIITTPSGTGPRRIVVNREPGSEQLTLWGNIPVDDPGASQSLAITDPADFAAHLLQSLLQKRGIVVYGRPRTRHTELSTLSTLSVTVRASGDGTAEKAALMTPQPTVLATNDSAPLIQDLKVINKVSQNLHAELALRLLGKEKGSSGSIEAGLEVMRGLLLQADIRPTEYALFDGSGLSRQNLVTPHAVTKLLTYAASQSWADSFLDTLPVGGVDGTLAERFKEPQMLGRVRAKTGSLGHVNALSGYITGPKNEHIAFSIFVNNHTLTNHTAIETIDQIVRAIAQEAGRK